VTVIAGPTASGKSKLAIDVALRLGAEIISADSQQVYRFFDIGTAKPSAEDLQAVPHHLISVVDPSSSYSAAQFQKDADEAIEDIWGRGRRVVVVGGTGLYVRALLHGVIEAPPRDDALRAEFEALADREGNEALVRKLLEVDEGSARRIHVADRLRLVRALEISMLSNASASERREAHGFAAARYAYRLWALDPERSELYEKINTRTAKMFEAGLLEETKGLLEAGYRDAAPMRSVGYAQAVEFLDGIKSRAQALDEVAQKTRHYAKRQWTWFKKEAGTRWLEAPYDVEAIVRAAEG
jgi:tRNA dimethylallyltransferase